MVSTVPLGATVLGQIVHGQPEAGLAMVMLKVACAVCTWLLESATCTVKVVVPIAVGVPEITPPADRVSPAGKVEPDAKPQV